MHEKLSHRLQAHVTSMLTLAERYGVTDRSHLATLESHAEAMLLDACAETEEDRQGTLDYMAAEFRRYKAEVAAKERRRRNKRAAAKKKQLAANNKPPNDVAKRLP